MKKIKKTAVGLIAAAVFAFGATSFASEITYDIDKYAAALEDAQSEPSVNPDSLLADEPFGVSGAEGDPINYIDDNGADITQNDDGLTDIDVPRYDISFYSESLDFRVDIIKYKYVTDATAKLEVYNSSGELVGSGEQWVGGNTDSITYHFNVPQYRLGEKFTVKLVDGLQSLQYNDTVIYPGGSFEITTYAYTDENGSFVVGNNFIFSGEAKYEKEVCVYVNDELMELSPRARLVNGYTMIPIRQVGEAIGLDILYDPDYDSVVCSVGDKEIIFNAGSTYCTFFGEEYYTAYPTSYIDGYLYIPARPMAEAFGCTVDALDFGDHLDVVIGSSPVVQEYREQEPVNKEGIASSTPYLIWVSKPEYKVRVYLGEQYKWELIKTFDCALGAWDTPTITGQFEYIEKLRSWDYPEYYVGPVMRFYNGYALHSTLLYYGGGEYDGRVGVNISHGCVRLHPDDINWMADMVPLGTKIYITE